MQVPPDQAQTMFVNDLAPELAKYRDFSITHERPGEVVFSDAVKEQDSDVYLRGSAGFYEGNELLARHIHVEFVAEAGGTLVTLRGHAEKNICDAIDRLGTPDHWPEIANRPHD